MTLDIAPAARLDRAVGARVFGTDAAGYAAGRVGYPDALFEAIATRSGQVDSLLEIGPGTGLATRALLERFAPRRLVAVEADRAMARYLRKAMDAPRVEIVTSDFLTASVEGPFDLAACAAAFHWLAPAPAFARLRKLLRSGGTLALWWHTYRQAGIGDPFADAVTPLLAEMPLAPSQGDAGHYSLDVELHRSAMTGAGFCDFEPHLFRAERTLDLNQLRALYASYSYVRMLPTEPREALLDRVVELGREQFGDAVPNVVLTALYLATAP